MTGSIYISFLLKGLLLVLLVVGMYFFVMVIREYGPLQRLREKVDDIDRQRVLSTETEKKSFFERYLDRLDEHLTQAGVKRFLPKASVEIYFLFNVMEFTLIFCLMGEGLLIPLMAAGIAVYANKLILDLLRFRNKRITENHLLELLNLISNYAISESEITMILYRCGQSMPNPLRDALTKCHLSARSSGNTELALYELRRSMEHFLFREIILLLELCSHSDNDYQQVVNGCREMVSRFLKEEKEKAAVVRSLIAEAGLMTGVAVYGISTMLREFAGDVGLGHSMTDFFFHNPAGRVYLLIYVGLLFVMTQIILKFARR